MSQQALGRQLLAESEATAKTFYWFPNEHMPLLSAFWVAHANLYDHKRNFLPKATPRLYIGSNDPDCGKTTLSDIIMAQCHGVRLNGPTSFALITVINNEKRPVTLDEIDRHFGNRGQGKQDQHIIINDGYKRGGKFPRQRNDEIMYLDAHGPMILTGKNANRFLHNEQWSTARSRSIPFIVESAPDGAYMQEWDEDTCRPRLNGLAEQFSKWGQKNGPEIVMLDVNAPGKTRRREIWKVFFQIAHFVGGNYPARLLKAYNAIERGIWDDEEIAPLTPAEELLAEVRATFDEDEEFIPTSELIRRVMTAPGTWWVREWKNAKAASMGLANYLGTFEIGKAKLTHNGTQLWGYERSEVFREVSNHPTYPTSDDTPNVESWDFSEID